MGQDIKKNERYTLTMQLQSNLALRTPRYNGHLEKTDGN